MNKFALPTALVAAAMMATPALAVPVQWTINGTFADGGTISGTYVYDNDVPGGLYSAVNVTTTAGTPVPTLATGASYISQASGASNGFEFRTAGGNANGERTLLISINGNMGNTAAVIPLRVAGNSVEGLCTNGNCTGAYGSPRNLTSGTITGVVVGPTPVPTLTEWAMIGLTGMLAAAGAAMAMRRRGMI